MAVTTQSTCVIQDRNQRWLLRAPFMGAQVLGEALARQADHGIGGREDWLRRSVVLLQRDELGGRIKLLREIEDVAHRGRTKPVDCLCIIADYREPGAIR